MSAYEQIKSWLSLETPRRIDAADSIIAVVLQKSPDEAIDWRLRHGDPLSDPISALLLAYDAGYDGAAILKSAIEMGGYPLTTVDNRLGLAAAVLELLFKSILSFPDMWGTTIN